MLNLKEKIVSGPTRKTIDLRFDKGFPSKITFITIVIYIYIFLLRCNVVSRMLVAMNIFNFEIHQNDPDTMHIGI